MPVGKRRYQIFLKSSSSPMEVYLINAKQDQEDFQEVSALSGASLNLGNPLASNLSLNGGSSISAISSTANSNPSPRRLQSTKAGKRKLPGSDGVDENLAPRGAPANSHRRQSGLSYRSVQKLSPLHVDEEFISLIEGEGGGVSEYFLGTDSDILSNLDTNPVRMISPLYSASSRKSLDQ